MQLYPLRSTSAPVLARPAPVLSKSASGLGILCLISPNTHFTYVPADQPGITCNHKISPADSAIIPANIFMENLEQTNHKKRSIVDVEYQAMIGKFRSKQDFVVFLGQHRTYLYLLILISLQFSFTCPTSPS